MGSRLGVTLGAAGIVLLGLGAGLALLRNPLLLLLPSSGPAEWIVYPRAPDTRPRRAVEIEAEFERVFTLASPPARAELKLRAFERAEITINEGRVALEDRTARDWKRPLRLDVAGQLRAGENRIRVTVRNAHGPPALWLRLQTGAGSIESDSSWRAHHAGAVTLAAVPASRPMDPSRLSADDPFPRFGSALRRTAPMLVGFALLSALALAALQALSKRGLLKSALGPGVAYTGVAALWVLLFANNLPQLAPTIGFDVGGHLAYVQFLLEQGRAPWPDEGWSAFHPPLYYAISALGLRLSGLPVTSPVASQLLRAQSALFALLHLTMVFLSLRLLFPGQPRRQVLGVLVAGFLPLHLYVFQYVTNETLATALASTALYLALRLCQREQSSLVAAAGLGVCLGAAMLTKFTGIIVAAAALGVLAIGPALARRPLRPGLAAAGVALTSSLAVCGWRYASVWWRHGTPIAANWAVGPGWWQDPGVQTLGSYLRFGRSLVAPLFAGYGGVPDGIYSTFWGDALLGGATAHAIGFGPPWNLDLMTVGYALALLPSAAIALGAAAAARRLVRQPSAQWLLLLGYSLALLVSGLFMTLRVASYAQAKSVYLMSAAMPLCAFAACGLDACLRRGRVLSAVVLVVLGTWALQSYATYWIPRGSAEAQARLGLRAMVEGQPDEVAAHHLTAALAAEPHNGHAWFGMALLLQRRGDSEGAQRALEALLDERPHHAGAHLQLAGLLWAQGAWERASTLARRATELAPEGHSGWMLLGAFERRRARYTEAAQAFRQALRIDPVHAPAHYQLAAVLAASGDTAAAQRRLESALKLDPSLAAARQ